MEERKELSDEIASLKMELRARIEDLEERVDALELAAGRDEEGSHCSEPRGREVEED